jgi:manganese/zinc/iron transport system permease protein
VSDAIAHATLPGRGLAFIIMVALGGDGRSLVGLSARLGDHGCDRAPAIQWIVARTRLMEDAAIGAVLGVFFGAGIVLLTVIQSMSSGRQAGLEGFLLGSTAGMLRQDAVIIMAGWPCRAGAGLGDAASDDAGRLRRRFRHRRKDIGCRAST